MAEIKSDKKISALPAHPPYSLMVTTAIKEMKDRKGSSNKAILKYLKEHYKVGPQVGNRLNVALRKLVEQNKLFQVKGVGARGVFKVPKKEKSSTADKKPRGRPAGVKKLETKKKSTGCPAGSKNKPKESKSTEKPKDRPAAGNIKTKQDKKGVKPKGRPEGSKNKPKET